MTDRPEQSRSRNVSRRWLALAMIGACACAIPNCTRAQSPELSLREFSSGQIKKGVRSIGFGGDGATWGNYGLVWRDADSFLVTLTWNYGPKKTRDSSKPKGEVPGT